MDIFLAVFDCFSKFFSLPVYYSPPMSLFFNPDIFLNFPSIFFFCFYSVLERMFYSKFLENESVC